MQPSDQGSVARHDQTTEHQSSEEGTVGRHGQTTEHQPSENKPDNDNGSHDNDDVIRKILYF